MECLRYILCVIHIVFGVIEPREDLHHQRTHDRFVRHKREPSLCRDLVPPLQPFPSGHLVASLLALYCYHKIIFHYSIFHRENVDSTAENRDCQTGLAHGSPFACLRKRERRFYGLYGFYRFRGFSGGGAFRHPERRKASYVKETLIQSQSQLLQEFLGIASS